MRTIWLASYPKSGNTWFRMLLSNLSAADGSPVNINDLPERGGIASGRGPLEFCSLIDTGLLTHDEIDRLRPRLYEVLARGERDHDLDNEPEVEPVRFVKVHDAYTRTAEGEPLLAGTRGASGAIVIVRDPRDIAPSFANHSGTGIDKAIVRMNSADEAFCNKTDRQHNQLRQLLLSWSGHVASWLDQTDVPVHLVRYEDMQADPIGIFTGALAFAGREASDTQIRQAVALSDFSQLRKQEQATGFREAPPHLLPDRGFFRRGQSGTWSEELTPEQAACIEAAHAPMMRRLGYDVTVAVQLAPAKEGQAA